jgi:predicted ribosomally synthesized peptide with SipW-like signal peptide
VLGVSVVVLLLVAGALAAWADRAATPAEFAAMHPPR